MSVIMHPVDIKCHTAVASTRDCKTGCLCPNPDFRFWDSCNCDGLGMLYARYAKSWNYIHVTCGKSWLFEFSVKNL